MQIDFNVDRPRGMPGQKFDTTSSTVISMNSAEVVKFGQLVCFGSDLNFGFLPKTKEHLQKPLGVALRMLHSKNYDPYEPMAIMRQGRVWVEAEDVLAPGDRVFLKLTSNGAIFTGKPEGNVELKNSIFLETQSNGLVPIEINLLGGV